MARRMFVLLLLGAYASASHIMAPSLVNQSQKPVRYAAIPDVDTRLGQETFLKNFGYLSATKKNISETEFRLALFMYQRNRSYKLTPTGVADEATKAVMKMQRCAVPDKPTALSISSKVKDKLAKYETVGVSFNSPTITYSIANTGFPINGISYEDYKAKFEQALALWAAVTCITFVEDASNPDIAVSFPVGDHGDGAPFDGPGGNTAHSFAPFPGVDIGGDIHFDGDTPFTLDCTTNIDTPYFLQIAAHEIGHALGLDHSSVAGSLMSAEYAGCNPDVVLSADDIAGITSLYDFCTTTTSTTSTTTPTTTPTSTTPTTTTATTTPTTTTATTTTPTTTTASTTTPTTTTPTTTTATTTTPTTTTPTTTTATTTTATTTTPTTTTATTTTATTTTPTTTPTTSSTSSSTTTTTAIPVNPPFFPPFGFPPIFPGAFPFPPGAFPAGGFPGGFPPGGFQPGGGFPAFGGFPFGGFGPGGPFGPFPPRGGFPFRR